MSEAASSAVPRSTWRAPVVSSRRLADVACGLVREVGRWRQQLDEDATFRTGLRLLHTAEYDAWLLRWPPGTNVEPHDHGEAKGVFTVASGELTELRWHAGLCRRRILGPGALVSIPAGVVHDVLSESVPSLSVHVYSPPLMTMGFFDGQGRRIATRPVTGEEPVAGNQRAHPAYGR
jgi:quercetin dioxygenase-like cupin family protein